MTYDGFHTYTYDAEGHITAVDGGATASYVYNALNQRVSTAVGGATTEYVFNAAGQRVSEWNGTTHAQLKGKYYWGGKPVAYYANGTAHFEHQDWLGTERLRTTYNGGVEGAYTSLPFGDGQANTGSDTDANHYATLDHDTETATDHAQFRQYTNAQGRWLSPDPYSGSYDVSNPQSFNRYLHAMNNPLAATDPSGLKLTIGIWHNGCGNNPVCTAYYGGGGGGGVGGVSDPYGSCCGTLGSISAQWEQEWLASGSISWYSVSGGDLMLFIPSQWTFNPNYNGGTDILIGRSTTSYWLDLGPIGSGSTSYQFGAFGTGGGGGSAPNIRHYVSVLTPQSTTQKASSWLSNYTAQVGCEAGASASQAEPLLGSVVATAVWAGAGRYKVAGAFGVAYLSQVVYIREQCVQMAWGSNYF